MVQVNDEHAPPAPVLVCISRVYQAADEGQLDGLQQLHLKCCTTHLSWKMLCTSKDGLDKPLRNRIPGKRMELEWLAVRSSLVPDTHEQTLFLSSRFFVSLFVSLFVS